jgi:hypothetical protein
MARSGYMLTYHFNPRHWLVALALLGVVSAGPAGAFNYVTDANGT